MHSQPMKSILSASGLPVKPLYRPEDIAGLDYERDLGDPGQPPYTRGIYPEMYRRQLWTIRPLAGFATAEDTNARCRWLLAEGATGVNVTIDYSTLRGYDSIDPIAAGDAGLGGVVIDSADDAAALVDGIDISRISVSLVTCNPIAATCVFPMYLAAARRRGLSWIELQGTTQNDFLMETVITTSPTVLQPAGSFRLSCDIAEFCARHVPRWHPISFAGYNYCEAGATAIQEGGLVLAHALAVARELLRRGVEATAFLPRLSFFLSAGNDFFEEIAKFRALRKTWAHVVADALGVEDRRCRQFRFHVQTSGAALTRQQPLNNAVRAAYHALAAVLGGAQSLHLSAYDEVFGLPSEQAAKLALRTQQILALESNVTATADPLAGSYCVEALTNEIEERVLDYVRRVEDLGGIVRAVETGWVHRELANSSYEYQRDVDEGRRPVVGVNVHGGERSGTDVERFRPPETVEPQRRKLGALRQRRDGPRVERLLEAVQTACGDATNLVAPVLDVVEAGATTGEIGAALRRGLGTWHMPLL